MKKWNWEPTEKEDEKEEKINEREGEGEGREKVPREKSDMQIDVHHNSDALVLFSTATMSTVYIISRITSQMHNLLTAAAWNELI